MKAVLVIDNIQEEWFENNLSVEYELLYYPNGEMKELGIHGKCHLKPLPQEKEELYYPRSEYEIAVNEGYNKCLDKIVGEEEK